MKVLHTYCGMIEGTHNREIMIFKWYNSARSISVEVCVAQSYKRLTDLQWLVMTITS